MRNVLYKVIKVVHAVLWFPLSPLIGPDFPQRLFRGRRKKPTQPEDVTCSDRISSYSTRISSGGTPSASTATLKSARRTWTGSLPLG